MATGTATATYKAKSTFTGSISVGSLSLTAQGTVDSNGDVTLTYPSSNQKSDSLAVLSLTDFLTWASKQIDSSFTLSDLPPQINLKDFPDILVTAAQLVETNKGAQVSFSISVELGKEDTTNKPPTWTAASWQPITGLPLTLNDFTIDLEVSN